MSIQFCTAETDAKAILCPAAMNIPNSPFTCVGSRCMAWRWVKTHINDGHGGPMVESTDTHGYCGLAGKPWGEK
jgi:hypothetical protein